MILSCRFRALGAIAAGEYPIDSFPVRKREAGHEQVLEGFILMQKDLTRPYHLPYRILVPKEVDGLLVPVAASTTHIAFSSIRLEPTWMALGQAAAAAAHLALEANVQPRDVDVKKLQRLLLEQNQVLTYFRDLDRKDPSFLALQYYGTKGFFRDYDAQADQVLTHGTAAKWIGMVASIDWAPAADETPLTHRAALNLLPQLKLPDDDESMTRGEFCRALFDVGF